MKDTNTQSDSPFVKGEPEVMVELPRYRSHKEVWALKIDAIHFDADLAKEQNRETDGGAFIYPEDRAYRPFKVDANYVQKHNPQAGGYYVVYQDGYKSWSPAEAFESGYTRIRMDAQLAAEYDNQ